MIEHEVRVHRSAENFPRHEQLAWMIAEVATDPVALSESVTDMVINRIIDNAAVAAAAARRRPVLAARAQARRHPYVPGATVFSLSPEERVSPEWAAWANNVAVRELDFHDTFLAEEFAHPGDNIPPMVAVAQHRQRSGIDLIRGIATGYEIQVDLAKGINLHAHRIDHVAHLGPSVAAGLGTLLGLPTDVVYQAIQQSLHTTTATRQSRKGEISSWKAYAPAFAAKVAIEAVDRAMRGESSPSPIYEGEDGVIAWLLGGPEARYLVPLPGRGEEKRAILETFTKEYSAEYQAQALIDLAKRMRNQIADLSTIESVVIRTSNHTHSVIGTGSNDPQKFDPHASRETLDHSGMYIFAVALEDGSWHHEQSYSETRRTRPSTIELWKKISTIEDHEWTDRYHDPDPAKKAFGGEVTITFADGTSMTDALDVADAHPSGARPFARSQYIEKFRALTDGVASIDEQDRFLDHAERLATLSPAELSGLTFSIADLNGPDDSSVSQGLF